MRTNLAVFILALWISALPGMAQASTPELNKQLTAASQQLSAMRFDSASPVTVRGRVATLVWPEGVSGMMVVEVNGGAEKYAFSTAGVPAMAKQGFSRLTMRPGEEVIVTGVLATGGQKIGPGFTAARADLITKSDGNRVFDRTRLPGGESK